MIPFYWQFGALGLYRGEITSDRGGCLDGDRDADGTSLKVRRAPGEFSAPYSSREMKTGKCPFKLA